VILMNMKETLDKREPFRLGLLTINRKEIIEKRVLGGALITLLSYLSYGVILTVIADWSMHLGVGNKGLFFMVFTVASLIIRFLSGKMSDRVGRVSIIRLSLILLVISLVFIGISTSAFQLMCAS